MDFFDALLIGWDNMYITMVTLMTFQVRWIDWMVGDIAMMCIRTDKHQ